MISATSPNQEGVEGIDSRSGLDTHRDIGHTSHVYLLVGNSVVLPHQGGTFLSWFATGYISLRNSWELGGSNPRYTARSRRVKASMRNEAQGRPRGCPVRALTSSMSSSV